MVKFLVFSDSHIGLFDDSKLYKHMYNDSFEALKEILEIALKEKVDFALNAGDFFDKVNPSKTTLQHVLAILQRAVMGERRTRIRCANDPDMLPSACKPLNFEDPNYKIRLPIFVIHGNHDCPSGIPPTSPLDILATSRLINFIGTGCGWDNDNQKDIVSKSGGELGPTEERLRVVPITLECEGGVAVSIYGVGFIPYGCAADVIKNAEFVRAEDKGYRRHVHVCMLHTNYLARGSATPVANASSVPDWMDIIVWGHEHRSVPVGASSVSSSVCSEVQELSGVQVLKPGAPVPVAMKKDEGGLKYVFIVNIDTESTITDEPTIRVKNVLLKQTRTAWFPNVTLTSKSIKKVQRQNMRVKAEVAALVGEAEIEKELRKIEEDRGITPSKLSEYPTLLPLVAITLTVPKGTSINVEKLKEKFQSRIANRNGFITVREQTDQHEIEDTNESIIDVIGTSDEYANNFSTRLALKIKPTTLSTVAFDDYISCIDKFSDSGDPSCLNDFIESVGHIYVQDSDKGANAPVRKKRKTNARRGTDIEGEETRWSYKLESLANTYATQDDMKVADILTSIKSLIKCKNEQSERASQILASQCVASATPYSPPVEEVEESTTSCESITDVPQGINDWDLV